MARPSGPKDYCGGRWTYARRMSFIKNQLRSASRKWAPVHDCKTNARTRRGVYLCAGCGKEVPASVREGRKRVNNIFVDHVEPVVPVTGWVSWDSCIDNMFCEEDNLQLLCGSCHDEKSAEEAGERKVHRQANKEE